MPKWWYYPDEEQCHAGLSDWDGFLSGRTSEALLEWPLNCWSLTKVLLVWLPSLIRRPTLEKVLAVSDFLNVIVIEDIVLMRTVRALEVFFFILFFVLTCSNNCRTSYVQVCAFGIPPPNSSKFKLATLAFHPWHTVQISKPTANHVANGVYWCQTREEDEAYELWCICNTY